MVRFGAFEVNPETGELRKDGFRISLHGRPLQILLLLLEHPGELVTREEMRRHLWSADIYVDFEHGLNSAVRRLRDALGDSANAPRFIETIPRQGYRFVSTLTGPAANVTPRSGRSRRATLLTTASVAVILVLLVLSVSVSPGHRSVDAANARQIRSLAVLPFRNLTGDPAQDYVAEGITDALTGTFSQLGGLTVISSTSASRYRQSTAPAPRIATELGVDALLEGAVLRDGNRVRIDAALVSGRTARRLWTSTYERDLGNVLELYANIAETAAREMHVILTDSQRARLAVSRPVNTEAYDEYLRGTYFMTRWTAGGCANAERHFLRSIELDPTFAPPHADLVWCYVFPDRLRRPISELAQQARAFTTRALELDPALAAAYVGDGLIHQFIDYDWQAAEQAFRRAIELDPGSAQAHNAYGDLLYMRGRPDESITMLKRALQLDPFSPDRNLGLAFGLMNVRRFDEASEQLRSTLELDPQNATAVLNTAFVFEVTRHYDEAVSFYLTWMDQTVLPDRARRIHESLEAAYTKSGWTGFWHEELAIARQEAASPGTVWKAPYGRYAGPAFMALRHARLGDRDLAFAFLEEAFQARHHLIATLNVNPLWDSVRADRRFDDLIRRIGLER